MSRRRLLVTSGAAPWPPRGGFSLRTARLVEELARLADPWEIVLVVGSPMDRNAFPMSEADGHRVVSAGLDVTWTSVPRRRFDYRVFRDAVRQTIQDSQPEVALLGNGTEFLALGAPSFPPAVADRVDCGALERWRYVRAGRWLRRPKAMVEYRREVRYERRIVGNLGATIVAGEDDCRALEDMGGIASRVHVIPNGVDATAGIEFDRENRAPTVAFTGTLSYYANADAAIHFAHSIWPLIHRELAEARFVVAGRGPTRRVRALSRLPGVEVRPDVPDMTSILEDAWVAVAPMRCGAGVKNKVLEAWAVGRATVLTPMAANGLELDSEARELVMASPADFAQKVLILLRDPMTRHRYGASLHKLARTRHRWETSAHTLSMLLDATRERLVSP